MDLINATWLDCAPVPLHGFSDNIIYLRTYAGGIRYVQALSRRRGIKACAVYGKCVTILLFYIGNIRNIISCTYAIT